MGSFDGAGYSFNGIIDEVFVTNETLSNATIRYMYLSGKRALMANDRTSNQLYGSSNNVTAVAVDDKNEFIYAGTQSASEGGALSKIGVDSDVREDYWADSSHADDFGTAFAQDNIRAVSAHADILAFATNYSFWAETRNWSFREHMDNSFNQHGANLVQDKITTNFIDVKDGQKLVIGNNVNNNVKVGIGTTSPGSTLTVKGATSDSTASALNITSNGGTSLLLVRNDGNVGIGTTSPQAALDIQNYQFFRYVTKTFTSGNTSVFQISSTGLGGKMIEITWHSFWGGIGTSSGYLMVTEHAGTLTTVHDINNNAGGTPWVGLNSSNIQVRTGSYAGGSPNSVHMVVRVMGLDDRGTTITWTDYGVG